MASRLAAIDAVKANDIITLLDLEAYDLVEELITKGSWKDYINYPAVLDGRVNPNLQDEDGDREGDFKSPSRHTALMSACLNKLTDTTLALKLIESDRCDYNLQSKDGDREGDFKSPSRHTVLMYACQNNLTDTTLALKLIETGKCDYKL